MDSGDQTQLHNYLSHNYINSEFKNVICNHENQIQSYIHQIVLEYPGVQEAIESVTYFAKLK